MRRLEIGSSFGSYPQYLVAPPDRQQQNVHRVLYICRQRV